MGIYDRLSVKAYFGVQETKSKRSIMRTATYARTGTISNKTITLSQNIKPKAGYLQQLGLVTYEKRGPTWFLLLEPTTITPEISHPPANPPSESETYDALSDEGLAEASIDKIYLTPNLQGEEHEKPDLEGVSSYVENEEGEREL
jgi:hypothetical protein